MTVKLFHLETNASEKGIMHIMNAGSIITDIKICLVHVLVYAQLFKEDKTARRYNRRPMGPIT